MNNNDNQTSSASQCAMIANYLNAGNSITALEALNLFGCMRLASRIHDLRERGMDIVSQRVQVASGKYVTEYKLNGEKKRCCICGKTFIGWGNNPWPVCNEEDAECCYECNINVVVPARLGKLTMYNL